MLVMLLFPLMIINIVEVIIKIPYARMSLIRINPYLHILEDEMCQFNRIQDE